MMRIKSSSTLSGWWPGRGNSERTNERTNEPTASESDFFFHIYIQQQRCGFKTPFHYIFNGGSISLTREPKRLKQNIGNRQHGIKNQKCIIIVRQNAGNFWLAKE